MTLDDNDKINLIRYRIEEAEETIEDVRLLIENDRLRAAVNRIYYGMFYSLLALGLAHGFETSKHPHTIDYSIFTTGRTIPELIDNAIEDANLYFEDEIILFGIHQIGQELSEINLIYRH